MINNLIVILLIVSIGFHFYKKKNNGKDSNRKIYIQIVSCILILQSGLRNVAVGDDTYGYSIRFNDISQSSYNEIFGLIKNYLKTGIGIDPGYILIEKVFNDLTFGQFQLFLLCIASFFFYSLARFVYANTKTISDITLAYVIYSTLFFSFYSITGIRQTISTAIVLFAIPYIKKRNFLLFITFIFIAFTIHKSALIFIPFYFMNRFKSMGRYIFLATLLLFPILMSLKGSMLSILQSFMGYEQYKQYEGAGTYVFTALFLVISILFYIRRKEIYKINGNANYYLSALALCLVFLPLSWINPSMLRVIMYFSIYLLVIIPTIINSYKKSSRKIYMDMKIASIVILTLLYMNSNLSFEYRFYWDEMRLNEQYYRRD